MSKVDPTQDYYGALEVGPDAGEDEIRKQYYKLARKYHPDRNPGKELEFQPRFQQIQAAHECLMDPEQRRKYDLSRKRVGGASTHAPTRPAPFGQRGNPYKATSSYPPPPRPPGAPPRKNDAPQPPPRSSGADRYKEFSYPPPPRRAGDDSKSGAQARADVWSAWQKMNSAQNARNARNQPYHSASRPETEPPPAQPPRSAYDTVNNQPRTNSRPVPPRPRYGKAPPSGDGDSSPRMRDRPFGRANPPRMNHDDLPPRNVPQVPPRASARPDGATNGHAHTTSSGDNYDNDPPFTEDLRERTPYASQPGERTSFFGGAAAESIRRTRSVRDATKLHSPEEDAHGHHLNRHRSMSPTSRASGSSHSNVPPSSNPRPPRPNSSRQSSGQPWVHYSSGSDSEGDHVPVRRRTYAAPGPSDSAQRSEGHQANHSSHSLNKSRSYDGNSSSSAGPRSADRSKGRQRRPMFEVHSRGGSSSRSGSPSKTTTDQDAQFPPGGTTTTPGYSPTASVHHPPGPNPGIQVNSQPMPPPPPPKVHIGPEDGQASGLDQPFKFEGWGKPNDAWAFQPGPSVASKKSPPTRPASNTGRRLRTAAAQMTSNTRQPVPDPTAAEVQESLEKGIPPPTPTVAMDEDDAMDIDEQPPISTSRRPSVVPDSGSDISSSAAAHAAQHHISADPPRSGWGLSPSATNSRRASAHGIEIPSVPVQGPPQSAPVRPSSQTISMDSFRHVLPGPTNGAGIRNLDDLGATLPFESRAAATAHPLKVAEAIAGESIPRPPLAPLPPSTFTQQTWDTYLASMSEYITKWNAYNMRMVAHFQDRCIAMAEFGHTDAAPSTKADGSSSSAAVVDNWLGAVGETNSQKGWASYVQQLRQDEAWRVAWSVACERHAEAIDKHGSVRERLLARGC